MLAVAVPLSPLLYLRQDRGIGPSIMLGRCMRGWVDEILRLGKHLCRVVETGMPL